MRASEEIFVPIRTRVLLRGLVGTIDSERELSVEYWEDSADVTGTSSGKGILDLTSITRVVISESGRFWTPPKGTYILTALDGRGRVALDNDLMGSTGDLAGSMKLAGLLWRSFGKVADSDLINSLRFFSSSAIFWCEINKSNVFRILDVPTQSRRFRMEFPIPDVRTMWCLEWVRLLTSSQYKLTCLWEVPNEFEVAWGTNLSPSSPTSKFRGVVLNPSSWKCRH